MNKLTNNDLKLLKEKYPDTLDLVLLKINSGYPVQYLIGTVDFYGYQIDVNENVLIPRFETEYLIEKTIKYLKKYNFINPLILDIGTGSGCIAITLKKEIISEVEALDISPKALKVAKTNAIKNNANIKFKKLDILTQKPRKKYDVIISNPPYIANTEEVDQQTKYEPQNALFAQHQGLEFYERILSLELLKDKAFIAFEIGSTQAQLIVALAREKYPNASIIVEKDYANKDRYIFIFQKCE